MGRCVKLEIFFVVGRLNMDRNLEMEILDVLNKLDMDRREAM